MPLEICCEALEMFGWPWSFTLCGGAPATEVAGWQPKEKMKWLHTARPMKSKSADALKSQID